MKSRAAASEEDIAATNPRAQGPHSEQPAARRTRDDAVRCVLAIELVIRLPRRPATAMVPRLSCRVLLAVVRLITRWNLVGCLTERSAGFAAALDLPGSPRGSAQTL
jgi:hypothetical protein